MNYDKIIQRNINKIKNGEEIEEDFFKPTYNRQMNPKKIKKKKYERLYDETKN